jgi:hypothetical protein
MRSKIAEISGWELWLFHAPGNEFEASIWCPNKHVVVWKNDLHNSSQKDYFCEYCHKFVPPNITTTYRIL